MTALPQLAWLVYSIIMHGCCGQTVGKMVTKVRVVDARTEGPISWGQAFLRDAVPLVAMGGLLAWQFVALLTAKDPRAVFVGTDGQSPTRLFVVLAVLPGMWLGAELLTMLTNRRRRALHDFLAGTVVVRTNVAERGRNRLFVA